MNPDRRPTWESGLCRSVCDVHVSCEGSSGPFIVRTESGKALVGALFQKGFAPQRFTTVAQASVEGSQAAWDEDGRPCIFPCDMGQPAKPVSGFPEACACPDCGGAVLRSQNDEADPFLYCVDCDWQGIDEAHPDYTSPDAGQPA